jgi:CHAT domain-containing protein
MLKILKSTINILVFILIINSQAVLAQENEASKQDFWANLVNNQKKLTENGNHKNILELSENILNYSKSNWGDYHKNTGISYHILASVYFNNYQFQKALPLFENALAILDKALGPEHGTTIRTVNSIGVTYTHLAYFEKAIEFQTRMLAAAEKNLSSEHGAISLSLHNLSNSYVHVGQLEKAHSLLTRAFQIRAKTLGLDNALTLESQELIALINAKNGQYKEAVKIIEQIINARKIIHESDTPELANSLIRAASIYSLVAEYDEALLLAQKSLTINEKLFGKESIQVAKSLDVLASLNRLLGKYELAQFYAEKSIYISQNIYGLDHLISLSPFKELAYIYNENYQYTKALEIKLKILDVYRKVYGENHPDTATAMRSLAVTYQLIGEYDTAIDLSLNAIKVHEKVLGKNHPEISNDLRSLSYIYNVLGQYEKALPLQKRSLQIDESVYGKGYLGTADSINALSSTYHEMKEYGRALALQDDALKIQEKFQKEDHPNIAQSLHSMAGILADQSKHDAAIQMYQRAININVKLFGAESPAVARNLLGLAYVYSSHGKYQESLSISQQALAILTKELGTLHPETARALANYSIDLIRTEVSPIAAIIGLKKLVNIYQNQRYRVSNIGNAELSSYTNKISGAYKVLALLLTEQGRLAEAQQVLDMLKEEEQFELIRRNAGSDPRRSRVGYSTSEKFWIKRYEEIGDRLASLGFEDRELDKAAKLGDLTIEQRQRQQALASDLAIARKAFTSHLSELRAYFATKGEARVAENEDSSLETLIELQGLIGSLAESSGGGVALVQYFVTDEQVSMLVTMPGVQFARSSKINFRELNRLVANFRRQLRDPKSKLKDESQELYKLLFAPIVQDLEQAKIQTVMLSLDGTLRYLPFSALYDGRQYLAQRWRLPIFTSVARKNLLEQVRPRWRVAGLGLTKAIAGFAALPAVRDEMRNIVKTRIRSTTGILPGEVYLDEAFNASRLNVVGTQNFELLHVASHFQFSPGTEINSYLLLGDGQRLTLGDIRTRNFRFDNVDLLSLSACDTGLGGGRDENGREIEGFGVIAQQQGAKAVLATLWPVADSSTAELMTDLYRRRQKLGLSKAEALRQAQVAMLKGKFSHPFYWAPFILMGNWK